MTSKTFTWLGHTITWRLANECRADLTCETASIPHAIADCIRIMVMHNIKTLTVDDQEIARTS